MNEATYMNDKVIKILILGDCQVGKTKFLLEYIRYNNNGTRSTCNNRNVDDERVDDNDKDDDDDYDEVNNNNNTENGKEPCVECGATTIDGHSSWEQYIPTSIEVYRSEFKINDIDYSLSITDISGNRQHDLYVQMRNYFYLLEKRIDVILLCFSLVDLNSYANITKKWMPEIKKSYPDVPIVLVGTKSDLKQRLKELKKASVKSNQSFNKSSNSAADKPDEDTKVATPSKNDHNTLAKELASFTKILESQLDESSRSPRKSNLKNLTSKSISILAYEVQLAKTTQLDEEQKPNESPISTASERPHSVISRISRDDLFSDLVTSNLNDYKRNNENFKQLLIKLNSIPAYLTLNDFIKLNIVDDDIEEDIEQINNDNLFNDTTVTNDTTVMNSSNTNEPRRKYVNKRQIIRLKEEINAKFYFKISLHDLNSIKNLMNKSILTAINYHLKRDKLMFIKQTVNKCNQAANSKLVDSNSARQTPLNANLYLDINLADPCRTIDDDILIRCGDSKSVKNVDDKAVKTSDTKGRGRLCGGLSRFKCFGCTRSETGTSLNTI